MDLSIPGLQNIANIFAKSQEVIKSGIICYSPCYQMRQ